jgi:hypothetical protein
MHGDVLRALAGPSRRVGTCQTQTVGEHLRMGTIENITIGLLISLLLLYPLLKCLCYPMLIPNISVTSFFLIRCLFLFLDP